jgi:hypothetical protein
MVIEIVRNVMQGSDSIEHLVGKRFKTYDVFQELWEEGQVEILVDGGIYPIAPEEYVVVLPKKPLEHWEEF